MNYQMENTLNGFISYSHADAKEVVELKARLEEFTNNRTLALWYDREIGAGTKWEPEIEEQLNGADIIVFCISDNFLKSNSCRDEFRKAIELKRETYAEIIPIILKECKWQEEKEISVYQAIPEYGKPVVSFEAIEEAYVQISKVITDKINLISRRKRLVFVDAFNVELQSMDPLLTVSGSEHLDLRLEDVYVDLELNDQWDNGKESTPIQGTELVPKLINGERLLISGDSQSGKTSLCKNLCFQLLAKCHFPVYMSGKEAYQGDAAKMIDRIVRGQYTDSECIDRRRVILILDDFHKCKHFEKFLAGIPKCCSVLLVLDDVYSLNLRNTVELKEYHPFVILPLRARKRNELIKKWLTASRREDNYNHGLFDNYKTQDRLVTHVESTLGKMFGRGLIPAYPFYILSILITSETAAKPLNQEISSQGYCYQVLLYAVLWRVGVRNQHMDMYVNILTELAYMLFKKHGAKKCDEEALNEFVKEYSKKFNLPVSAKQIFDNLERAKVFGVDGLGYYDFHYSYLKYYFIAKYMAEHYDDCDADFEHVFSHLGSSANAYIAIFVAHHERSIHYLNRIVEKTVKVFNGVAGCYLSHADMKAFDNQSKLIVKAALPGSDNNPDEERDKLLAEKEKVESVQAGMSSADEEIADPELRDFVIAIRLCQVVGQILKTRPASIPVEIQQGMIKSIIDAYARILRLFFDTFNDKDTQDSIVDYISYTLGTRMSKNGAKDPVRMRSLAERIFWNLNFAITYGLMIHCVYAIGSSDLANIIKSTCSDQKDAPLMMIIPYVVEVIFKKKVDVDGMKRIFPNLPETVKNMLRFVVVYFCRTHHVLYKERQKVEQLFELKPLLPLFIENQRATMVNT